MIDRIDFPKRYPVPSWLMLAVVILALMGIMINESSQKRLVKNIIITNTEITEYSRVHIEVQYNIQNLLPKEQTPNLLLKVYDLQGNIIASTLFRVKLPAQRKISLLKIIDKLVRTLDKGEKPGKVTLEVYPRKVI